MTVAEAAQQLEVSVDLVYRLCRAGRLGHRRIGLKRGVIRIDQADIDAFLAGRRVEGDDSPDEPSPRSDPRRIVRKSKRAELPLFRSEIRALERAKRGR